MRLSFQSGTIFAVLKQLIPLVLGLTIWAGAAAQVLPTPFSQTAESAPPAPPDPLGRETPNGSFLGFLNAARQGNYKTAAQYLQLSPTRQSKGEELAAQLKRVLDHALVGPMPVVTDNSEGTVQEGVPLDRERIGQVSVEGQMVGVDLIHVHSKDAGRIWLFSADTLAKVPELADLLKSRAAENALPAFLVENEFLEAPLWQWLALLGSIPSSAGLAWTLIILALSPVKIWRHRIRATAVGHWARISGPAWLIATAFVNAVMFSFIGFPLIHRRYYFILLQIALVLGTAWLALQIVTWTMDRLKNRALAGGRPETVSLVLLGQRVLKAVVGLLAGLAIMRAMGFDMSTALAGVGIGGLAVSLGAKTTIENLFGGASILADSVIHVGDLCRFGDRLGTVEDISLRSTRIRTVERTELSIPNGILATVHVENLSRRDKMLFNPSIGLRYETTPDQLRFVLAELRRLLYGHAKVETATARARLVEFGESALSVEIFCYVTTRDMMEFAAIREDLLLRIMDIVAEAGTGFAFPSRTVYLGKDGGLDGEASRAAEAAARQWRENRELPFPDFSAAEIAAMRDSIPYPPPPEGGYLPAGTRKSRP